MLPFVLALLRTYAPYIVLPFAVVVGTVGYTVEHAIRGDKQTPFRNSIIEERNERFLKEGQNHDPTEVDSLKKRTFVPKTIFERKQ